jgi:DivIVA domain-containing protein
VRRGGYETNEVDTFLRQAGNALEAGDGQMQPEDARDARFTLVKRGGYNTEEVDAFLDELMEELERRLSADPLGINPGLLAAAAAAPLEAPPLADPALPVPPKDPARAASVAATETDVADGAGISAYQLRRLIPPRVDSGGYDVTEVDGFMDAVADTLVIFEGLHGEALDRVRGNQYLQGADGGPLLLSADQIRWSMFKVRVDGGYEQRGVDAAIRRLGKALDYHWLRD